jgi:hypothetical protein
MARVSGVEETLARRGFIEAENVIQNAFRVINPR